MCPGLLAAALRASKAWPGGALFIEWRPPCQKIVVKGDAVAANSGSSRIPKLPSTKNTVPDCAAKRRAKRPVRSAGTPSQPIATAGAGQRKWRVCVNGGKRITATGGGTGAKRRCATRCDRWGGWWLLSCENYFPPVREDF